MYVLNYPPKMDAAGYAKLYVVYSYAERVYDVNTQGRIVTVKV